jgi:hypothetical protein
MMAVRRVINSLFSQRSKELETNKSQSKSQRGKRLNNTTGLNITDDEFFTKMEQQEYQKKQKKSPKESSITGASSSTERIIKRRGRPSKKNNVINQSIPSHFDSGTEAAYAHLQSAIDITNTILNDSNSDSV